jgi:threonine synthase
MNLPQVSATDRVSLGEGMTPLVRVPKFPGDVRAKLEFTCPTGSFKDRGNSIVVTRLKQIGISRVVEDSSGNAGASLAAYCAHAGIGCTIYAPASASAGKLAQIRIYGAEIVAVPGARAAATEAALAATNGNYYANHAWDPFFFEGTKTAAFEIVEQLGGAVPARVLLPVGQGTMLLGLAKGFRELLVARRIAHVPQLIAVQSDLCAPIYEAFQGGLTRMPDVPASPRILAEGIATVSPLRWRVIMNVVRESAGEVVRVPDRAIPSGLSQLGRLGLFVEPTSATVLLALDQLRERRAVLDGTSVMILTGSGLKATAQVEKWLS